uniref:Uncharacterized protein n=1 Tax=Rhizophora mucronata TaxID=61149 RepID=A0A2P2L0T5_RHIMU
MATATPREAPKARSTG